MTYTDKPTYSTSTAGGIEPGAITLEIARRVIDRSILVTEAEILDATRRYFREEGQLIEGAAGVAVAAFLKKRRRLCRQDRGDRHLRRQPRSCVRGPRQGLIGEKSRSWMVGGRVGASISEPSSRPCSQRQVKSPVCAPVAAIGAVVSQSPTSALSLASSRDQCVGIAVEQEVHRELFAGRVDRARPVHRAGRAVGGRERFADRRLRAPGRAVPLRRGRPRHPRPRATGPA